MNGLPLVASNSSLVAFVFANSTLTAPNLGIRLNLATWDNGSGP